MFSHHILKPERTPIEANVWGTNRSSGSFSTLFRSRLLRAIDYRRAPIEIKAGAADGQLCAPPFTGKVEDHWPTDGRYADRAIYLSCGDSAETGLADASIDLVVTDPPFFDNVHYSELADFFYAWQQLTPRGPVPSQTTRSRQEVQDGDADSFAAKLKHVFEECSRILKDDGLLVFTYHHSRDEGWKAVAEAVLSAGFVVLNCHPVKSEMSVATPKAQTKEPIQLDIIIVCRKADAVGKDRPSHNDAVRVAHKKIDRLHAAGFELSRNDQKIVLFGQLLTTLRFPHEAACFAEAEGSFKEVEYVHVTIEPQLQLFQPAE
jgi:putative DNA methylase